jgi:predicted O-methyltransferase YrrM
MALNRWTAIGTHLVAASRRLGRRPILRAGRTVRARHSEWSVISSADDLVPQPSEALLGLLLDAAHEARHLSLDTLAGRTVSPQQAMFLRQWPGEHYRLLAGLVRVIAPRRIVEIGTATGMSALALLSTASEDAELTTYDVLGWKSFPNTVLHQDDFGPRLRQRLADLSQPDTFEKESEILGSAELIFIDGPKDGVFESLATQSLIKVLAGRNAILVYDDIRVMNMVQFWRELPLSKLDATSLGHWSGTGLASTG